MTDNLERSVLGAVLLDPASIDIAVDMLSSKDFRLPENQIVFEAMLSLSESSMPIDTVSVGEKLRERGRADLSGTFLTDLLDVVPTSANIKYYCAGVKREAGKRRLHHAATDILRRIEDGDAVGDVLTDAEDAIMSIRTGAETSGPCHIKGTLAKTFDIIEAAHKNKGQITGLPTGFGKLDRLLNGLNAPDLTIIAARPSMGKSALAGNIAENIATVCQKPVLIFSLEMSREQIAQRMLCSNGRVNAAKMRVGMLSDSDFPKLIQAADVLHKAPIFIDDTPALSINEIRARSRRQLRESGLALVIVDYLQLVSARAESRQTEIAAVSRGLKALAKELSVPVVALSQLSRALESRKDKRPIMSDLRESGAIEQDADNIVFLYRPAVYDDNADPADASAIIAKQRSGPVGVVGLTWHGETTSFRCGDSAPMDGRFTTI